ncbi:ankyrin repeat and IBR domain-containing protein 1-like [Physella acuta]|uniref:ankyrin repeat and IBR domain-containing protein 1-like n=1 Tax=Physella acuta TaxID=109671 RepID=UPI0027DDBD19|nr:ankyrin repeat and IBR domain-containing protein 1-like [Physella acuta]XP_059164031.1 ankyrin repeat and IBR domain-containing protein 1-like [Physella acuta]XP_059164032.1 ankyrin repeat and IBR domain-containing protein 1-like [Physella acuta]XP_059164033.1 ankyrin repeat and IBR domain-containing protein 1-like [Physella acuta]XP_059164034.1 ankyrin repeat and IBR domain-containing protein 1-like [Physella acuta]XP_059164035.1 ankyrin repeat and IBR domain-containing protein 1-like [Phy
MGSASSKFRKHLQSGDEVQALTLYQNNQELRKGLDPNCSYGDSHHHETPLHLAAKHGMPRLLCIFLTTKGGNPNKTNARKETCLHCVCMEANAQSPHVCKRRAECLTHLLKWRGATLAEGQVEKINLAAQDEKLNTALHYAAASGLTQCVETLIQHGAPLFLENVDNQTPCDTAEKNGHARIALYLESKMVFSNEEEPRSDDDNISSFPVVEEYSGLRPQDLQEAKDQLLVETADMLSVPLFTAEALLRNHEWSREMLLEAWMTDPFACCEKCGVTPPATLYCDKPQVQETLASPLPSPLHTASMPLEAECNICADTFLIADEPVHMCCTHKFCKVCWERYLNVKIQEGDAHHITCPAYDCTMLVPVDIIERIVSRDMALRYLQFDIKAFVDSNPDMKWCPSPGCGRAVKLPDLELGILQGNKRNKIPSDTSRGVDCGVGHYFCWECLEESHEPCSCENWSKWYQKISEIRPDMLDGTEQETELAANCLWLVTNSKPCPNCKSPIQKNEGCNHMKCSKCKYDFCWVCLEQWKRHNSSTGGYFKCNRYEVVRKVEEQNAQMLTEAESKNRKMQELNRFVHYYTRFKNHENSCKLEEPLLKTAKDKMMILAEAVTDSATAHLETKFVEDAVHQLLKARRILKCSYVYGYYLDGPGYKKIVFEFMQTELEECTEILSQMVNRLYLRTPRRKIIEQAHVVQRKRLEFIMAISKGLVPPETPPSSRKGKRKRKLSGGGQEDEDLHRAIIASIQEVNPANPWIKDASGRHTNVTTLLEWPSPSDESEDSDCEPDKRALRESIGKCHRAGCNKVRARNPRTKDHHDYCSQYCMLVDRDDREGEECEGISEIVLDEHMELLRALEMSRLQYLRDSGLLHVPESQDAQKCGLNKGTQTSTHRPRSNSAGQETKARKKNTVLSSLEELGIESESFLSLKAEDTEEQQFGCRLSSHPNKLSQASRFDETRSTIVPRVPNKSVEDLFLLGQPAKPAHPGLEVSSSSSHLDLPVTVESGASACAVDSPDPTHGLFGSSMFGAIKDISVSNIHSNESDKTEDFLSKDLAALFIPWGVESNRKLDAPATSYAKRPLTLEENPGRSMYRAADVRRWTDGAQHDVGSPLKDSPPDIFIKQTEIRRGRSPREISLLEMTENLLKMTLDCNSRISEVGGAGPTGRSLEPPASRLSHGRYSHSSSSLCDVTQLDARSRQTRCTEDDTILYHLPRTAWTDDKCGLGDTLPSPPSELGDTLPSPPGELGDTLPSPPGKLRLPSARKSYTKTSPHKSHKNGSRKSKKKMVAVMVDSAGCTLESSSQHDDTVSCRVTDSRLPEKLSSQTVSDSATSDTMPQSSSEEKLLYSSAGSGADDNIIEYCLTRNISRDSLSERQVSPAGSAHLAGVAAGVPASADDTEGTLASSALITDAYDVTASDDNWEDASSMLSPDADEETGSVFV